MNDQSTPLLKKESKRITFNGTEEDEIPDGRKWQMDKENIFDLDHLADYFITNQFKQSLNPNEPVKKKAKPLWTRPQELQTIVSKILSSTISQDKKKQLNRVYQKYKNIYDADIPDNVMERLGVIGWVMMNEDQGTRTSSGELVLSHILMGELSELVGKYPKMELLVGKNTGESNLGTKLARNQGCNHGCGAFLMRVYLWWWWKKTHTGGTQQTKSSGGGGAAVSTSGHPFFIQSSSLQINRYSIAQKDVSHYSNPGDMFIYSTRCLTTFDDLMPRLMDLDVDNRYLVPEEFIVNAEGATQFWRSGSTLYCKNPNLAHHIMARNNWWNTHKKAIYRLLAGMANKIQGVRIIKRLPPQPVGKQSIIKGRKLTFRDINQQNQRSSRDRTIPFQTISTLDIRRAVSDINQTFANTPRNKREQLIKFLQKEMSLDYVMRSMGYTPPYVLFHGTTDFDNVQSLLINKPKQIMTRNKVWGEGFYVSPDWRTTCSYATRGSCPYIIAYMLSEEDAKQLKYREHFNTNLADTITTHTNIIALRDAASKKLFPFLVITG